MTQPWCSNPASTSRFASRTPSLGILVAGVEARITPDSRSWPKSALLISAEDGTISFGRLPDAATDVRVTGSHRADEHKITVPPGVPSATIRVTGSSSIACRVVLEDETPVTEALLEYADSPLPIPMAAQDGLFQVARQGVDNAPLFRFVTANAATAWIRLYAPKSEHRLIAHSRARIKGQVVDQGGAGVPGALITFGGRHGSFVFQHPADRPPDVVTTSDSQGFFEAAVGGSAIHLVEVSTSIGTCARLFVTAQRVTGTPGYPVEIKLPRMRAGARRRLRRREDRGPDEDRKSAGVGQQILSRRLRDCRDSARRERRPVPGAARAGPVESHGRDLGASRG